MLYKPKNKSKLEVPKDDDHKLRMAGSADPVHKAERDIKIRHGKKFKRRKVAADITTNEPIQATDMTEQQREKKKKDDT